MYKVIGSKKTRTMRVLWMLEELGQPYDHLSDAPRSDAVTQLNPSGKVPVLVDGTHVLTDSTAILTYLADKHSMLTYPAGTVARAHQDSLTQMVLDELDAILWTAARHSFILPEEMRLPQIKDSLRWEWTRSLDRLADRINGPFLTGDTMTVSDIICAHCLYWGTSIKFEVTPEPLQAFQKQMLARPAIQRLMA